ncbi:MAG TPA: hypothetical protein VG184_11465 [Acidimicrobiales bacterium]|jgi:hypothetical protein|nr:hypothetical protein [Acidimicrobiales bacterium]
MQADLPNPGLARSALAALLDRALAARLQEIKGNRDLSVAASLDYTLLNGYVLGLPETDELLQSLAMTALDGKTGELQVHSDRPFVLAADFRARDRRQKPGPFVAALVWLLVTDDLDDTDRAGPS